MDTRKEVSKEAVRAALQALGEGGKEISYRLVYEALGLENDAEQAVVRSRISDMTRHGEVKRTRTGCFTYDFKHRPREAKSYEALWRFVRKAKPGWSCYLAGHGKGGQEPGNAVSASAGNRPLCAGACGGGHHRPASALRRPLRKENSTKHYGRLQDSVGRVRQKPHGK